MLGFGAGASLDGADAALELAAAALVVVSGVEALVVELGAGTEAAEEEAGC